MGSGGGGGYADDGDEEEMVKEIIGGELEAEHVVGVHRDDHRRRPVRATGEREALAVRDAQGVRRLLRHVEEVGDAERGDDQVAEGLRVQRPDSSRMKSVVRLRLRVGNASARASTSRHDHMTCGLTWRRNQRAPASVQTRSHTVASVMNRGINDRTNATAAPALSCAVAGRRWSVATS